MDCFAGLTCLVRLTVNDGFYTNTSAAVVTLSNHPPVSVAGGPYSTECKRTAAAVFQLDGTRSSDPDGQPLTYHWSTDCPHASFDNFASATPKLRITGIGGIGCYVTLAVSDGQYTNSSQAFVAIPDTEPPRFARATASPSTLWPPNRRLVPVTIQGNVTDTCDPAPVWQIVGVTVSDSAVAPLTSRAPDYQITGPHTVTLRAERISPYRPRVYYVTVQAWDANGNTARQTVPVTVPLWSR
jgi:hypothetical protein